MAYSDPIGWNPNPVDLPPVHDGLPEPQIPNPIFPFPNTQPQSENEQHNSFFSICPHQFQDRSELQGIGYLLESLQTRFDFLSQRIRCDATRFEELEEDNRRLNHVINILEGQLAFTKSRVQQQELETKEIQKTVVLNLELAKAVKYTLAQGIPSTLPILSQLIQTHLDLEPKLRQARTCSDLQLAGTKECLICQDPTGHLIRLPCEHEMGAACLRRWVWLEGKTTCPLCRRNLPDDWIRSLESTVLLTVSLMLGSQKVEDKF